MGGHGGAIGLFHDLGVAVVRRHHGDAALAAGGLHHLANAGIHGLHGLDGRVKDAGVAHHVAVGEVQHDDVVGPGLDALDALLADGGGAHLRLEVIGGHLGRGDEAAVLPGENGLHAAVEEEGHVGVLLRLRDAQLGHAHPGEVLAQAVDHALPGEGHLHIGHGGVILRGADEGQGEELPGEAGELRVHQGAGQLPGPVGPEVEEDDAVVVADGALGVADHRLHELIRDAAGIGLPHGVDGVGIAGAPLAVDHGVVGLLHPVPALVPVHGVVAAHDGGDLAHADLGAVADGLLHKAQAGAGGHVPPVQEGVDIDLLQPLALGHPQQGVKVLDVGVDAAVAEKAHQVQGRSLGAAGLHGVEIGGVGKEAAVRHGVADPGQVLKDHPAAADVGVAHLAVAHLPVGQAHPAAGGLQLRPGVLGEEPVQNRRRRGGHGVARRLLPQAEAVHNDQGRRCFVHSNLISPGQWPQISPQSPGAAQRSACRPGFSKGPRPLDLRRKAETNQNHFSRRRVRREKSSSRSEVSPPGVLQGALPLGFPP